MLAISPLVWRSDSIGGASRSRGSMNKTPEYAVQIALTG